MSWPILSTVIFLPLLGAAFLFLIRGEAEVVARNARYVALWSSLVTFGLSLLLWVYFDTTTWEFQFVEKLAWVPEHDIGYHLGIDGISIFFVILTTFLTPICVLSSWDAIKTRVREYMIAFLVLETLVVGAFCALDFVMFYIFFEGMLIPMFLIIGVWGGPRRVYAAFKFFLYTMLGAVLFLLAILTIYFVTGTTDIPTAIAHEFTRGMQIWLWLALFASFAVKVPMWPFHTWLPDAHVEAPTAGSVILAGILLKLGGYGFLRFSLPMLPDATAFFTPFIFSLSVCRGDLHLVCRPHAGRYEKADRLFVGRPYGVRDDRYLHADAPRHRRRRHPDDQPRHHLGGALPLRRGGLRPDAQPSDCELRRSGPPHADLCRRLHGVYTRRRRLAGNQRLRRRVFSFS